MKKLAVKLLALIAITAGLSSCSNDEPGTVDVTGTWEAKTFESIQGYTDSYYLDVTTTYKFKKNGTGEYKRVEVYSISGNTSDYERDIRYTMYSVNGTSHIIIYTPDRDDVYGRGSDYVVSRTGKNLTINNTLYIKK